MTPTNLQVGGKYASKVLHSLILLQRRVRAGALHGAGDLLERWHSGC